MRTGRIPDRRGTPDPALRREAEAAARALLGEREALALARAVRIVEAFATAMAPACVPVPGLRDGTCALFMPRPRKFGGEHFTGTVNGLVPEGGKGSPLRAVIFRATLDAGLPARLAMDPRSAPSAGRWPRGSEDGGIDLGQSRAPETGPLWDAMADLVSEVRGGTPFKVRMPFATSVEEEPRDDGPATAWARWPLPCGGQRELYLPHPNPRPLASGRSEPYQELGISADAPWGTRQAVVAALSVVCSRLTGLHRSLHASALAAFRGGLDRQPLKSLDAAGSTDPALYGWLSAGGDARARLVRRQALEAYPVVASLSGNEGLTEAIDAGRPLVPALAGAMGGTPTMARSLAGLRDRDGVHAAALRAVPWLSLVPAANLPSPGGAETVGDQWLGVEHVAQGWAGLRTGAVETVEAGRDWVARRMAGEPPAWKKAGGLAACAADGRQAGDARDFVRAAARALLLPLALDACPLPAGEVVRALDEAPFLSLPRGGSAVDVALFDGRTLADVRRMSTRWHDTYGAIEAALALGEDLADIRWPGMTAPFACGQGVHAVPLTDAVGLSSEGAAMDHCVGTYALSCLGGATHVVSFRAGNLRLSTAEFRLDGTSVPACVQHKGHGNDEPPPAAAAALQAYLSAIGDGTLPVDGEAIRTAARGAASSRGTAALAVGYDPSDPARRDLAMRVYAFALPASARGMTHAAWAASLGLDGMMARAAALAAAGLPVHGHGTDPVLRAWGVSCAREECAAAPGREPWARQGR